jgi:hypothetical protein
MRIDHVQLESAFTIADTRGQGELAPEVRNNKGKEGGLVVVGDALLSVLTHILMCL